MAYPVLENGVPNLVPEDGRFLTAGEIDIVDGTLNPAKKDTIASQNGSE